MWWDECGQLDRLRGGNNDDLGGLRERAVYNLEYVLDDAFTASDPHS